MLWYEQPRVMIYGQPSTHSNSPRYVPDKPNSPVQGLALVLALVLVVGWVWGE